MLKKISIIIVLLLISFGAGYYFSPEKTVEVEKIVYKDKIVKQNQVVTKIEYKDGKTVTVTKTDTVEVEKEVIKEKTLYNNYTSEIAPIIGLTTGLKLDSVGAMYYHQFLGRIYLGAGLNYRIDSPDTYYIGDSITKDSPSFLDKTTLLVGIKIPFNI